MSKKIAIIGGGNLGTAIAEGLIQSGFVLPKQIIITKRNVSTLHQLERKGVLVSDDNNEAVRFADVIILAVKPFQVDDIIFKLKDSLEPGKHILVSVITGVTTEHILKIAGRCDCIAEYASRGTHIVLIYADPNSFGKTSRIDSADFMDSVAARGADIFTLHMQPEGALIPEGVRIG